MKVLFISSGNSSDGISTIILNQAQSLIQKDIDVQLFSIKGKGIWSYVKHIFILRKHLNSNYYDIFHAHYALSAFTASLAGCRPLVVSLMGSDTKSGILLKILIRLFYFMNWQTVIVKSPSMKEDVGIKNSIIIPNGVNINNVKPRQSKLDDSKKTILFASDPKRYSKNYKLAESAFSLLNNNIILKVVHSRPHEEIIDEINRADVILLTSLWEGSPNIIKESMACNRPIVSTRVGDVEWLFGNEPGHFLTSFDPNDVAVKIKEALEYSEVYKKTNGRQRIISLGLDSETIACKLIKVYEKLLKHD